MFVLQLKQKGERINIKMNTNRNNVFLLQIENKMSLKTFAIILNMT